MRQGTRFGEVHGSDLQELFAVIRSLPYKVEHKQTLVKPNGTWYIIYTLPDDLVVAVASEPEARKELEVINIKKNKRRGK